VSVESGLFVWRSNLEFMAISVDGEVGVFLQSVLGSRHTSINFSLQGGGVSGDDLVRIEGSLDFFLNFAAAHKEVAFEKFLSVKVNGVCRDFAANDAANVSTEISVKRRGPGSKGRV